MPSLRARKAGGLVPTGVLALCLLVGPASAAALENRPEEPARASLESTLKAGNHQYLRGHFRAALREYERHASDLDCKLGMALCLVRLGHLDEARPLLLETFPLRQGNADLRDALRIVNDAEIDSLESEVRSLPAGDPAAAEARFRLGYLYDVNGYPLKAARTLVASTPPASMDLEQLLHVAGLYYSAARYEEAADIYLEAVTRSPAPQITRLAAVDALLAGAHYGRAEKVLDEVARMQPKQELDSRYAPVYLNSGREARARKLYEKLASDAEASADSCPDPRGSRLHAADCFLNARRYADAERVLDVLTRQGVDGKDLDVRRTRLLFEQKKFSQAIPIYAKYPEDVDLQISKGWALLHANRIGEARRTFEALGRDHPGFGKAEDGYRRSREAGPWNLLVTTALHRSDVASDSRKALSQYLTRVHKKTVMTLAHSSVQSVEAPPGPRGLKEEDYGLKVYHQLDSRNGLEIRGVLITSNDVGTDRGNAFGGQYYRFPRPGWVLGLGYDVSNYRVAHASQLTVSGAHSIDDKVKLELRGIFMNQELGPGRNVSRETSAARAGITYCPSRKLFVNFARWFGKTQFFYFPDGMYGLNTANLYKDGWSVHTFYELKPQLKLFGKYGRFPHSQERLVPSSVPGGPPAIRTTNHEVTLTSAGINVHF
ncbi:MAG: hypothetical protein HY815_12690 [Candidatus Riflebacteria bacterium]|nr:hypothetical protein [Candidatus Riflebacteria bacterium]